MSLLNFTTVMALAFLTGTGISWAGDLEDKVGSYTDDSISAYHDMSEPTINMKSTVLKAKNNGKRNKTNKYTDSANMNGVIVDSGATVKGDIIIIDESKGPKTQIVDK